MGAAHMSMPVPKASEHMCITHLRQAWEKWVSNACFFWGSSKCSSDTAATLPCFVAFTTKRWHCCCSQQTRLYIHTYQCANPAGWLSHRLPKCQHGLLVCNALNLITGIWQRWRRADRVSPREYHLLGLVVQTGSGVYSPYYKSRTSWLAQLQVDPLHYYRKCLCIFLCR